MLDSSRPLLVLQTLVFDDWRNCIYTNACVSKQGLQLLVQCCPGLRDLQLDARVEEDADLSPLQQLQHLTALSVFSFALGSGTVGGLAALTGLRRLSILTAAARYLRDVFAWLTKLQNLDNLEILSAYSTGFDEDRCEQLLKQAKVSRMELHLET
jgi:hypothetical protein